MPYKRGKVFAITLDEADKLVLEKLAKRHKLSQKEIVGYLIGLDDKYNLMSGDWQKRLTGDDEERDRYAGLEGSCANMTFAKKNYICVRANLGKPPTIKALSEDLDEAHKICGICEEDTRKKLDRNDTLERVHELEAQLKTQATEKFKVPVCNYGGILAGDGVSFKGCRLNPSKTLSIEDYCKVRINGKPCTSYIERVIGVGKKI